MICVDIGNLNIVDKKVKAFAWQALRRSSYRWPPRWEAERESRVRRGVYQCNICKGEFRKKDTQMDHVDPIVPVDAEWEGFDEAIPRLLVGKEGWQRLCRECHTEKTNRENDLRRKKKKLDKSSKK